MLASVQEFIHSPWGVYVVSWIVAGLLMWIGAHVAGLAYPTIVRSLVAAICATLVTWMLAALLADSLGVWGFLVAICVTVIIIKAVFDTSWERAIAVWIFNAIAQFLLAAIGYNSGVLQGGALPHLH